MALDRTRPKDNRSSDSLSALETVVNQSDNSAPINRVPPEIINHIFSLYRDEEDQFNGGMSRLRLSQVCQLWRHAIINNPLFWTTINYSNNSELVATFIKRSGERKLRIELWDYAFGCPKKVALIKSTLITESYRIGHIEAGLSSLNLESIEGVLCRPFPSLRHLSFCRDGHDENLPLINSHIPFTLDISKLEVFEMDYSSTAPWNCLQDVISKVRKLSINLDRPEVVVSFFGNIRSFSGLEILSVECDEQHLPQLPVVSLPNVIALFIQDKISSPGGIPQPNPQPPVPILTRHLHIPNLKHFAISDCKGYTSTFHPDFDYASIRYLSIIAKPSNHRSSFCVAGSARRDKSRDDWIMSYESFLSVFSHEKQFQLEASFNQEFTGFGSSFAVLNELLPKMPGVLELCLPSLPFLNSLLCHTLLRPDLMIHYPSLTGFHLIRSTSDMHIYGRGSDLSS